MESKRKAFCSSSIIGSTSTFAPASAAAELEAAYSLFSNMVIIIKLTK